MWTGWGSTLLLRGHRWVYNRLTDLICSWPGETKNRISCMSACITSTTEFTTKVEEIMI